MKAAVFSLAALVFALGLAGSLGYGYESQWGYDNDDGYSYGGHSGYTGYGHKGSYERTVHIPVPYAVAPPPAAVLPTYGAGAVGGASDGGIFGELGLALFFPLMLLLLSRNNSG